LRVRLAAVEPAAVLFNGKDGLRRALGHEPGFGRLNDPAVSVGRAVVLCAPSSSGSARRWRPRSLEVFREAALLAFPE